MAGFDPVECHSSDGSILIEGGGALDFRAAGLGAFFALSDEDQSVEQTAELQAVLDDLSAEWEADPEHRQRVLTLEAGDLFLSEAIRWRSGVLVRSMPGGTRLRPDSNWNPAAGDADLRTNNLTYGEGDLLPAVMNTVLTTAITPAAVPYFGANTRKLSVTSTDSLAAGDYFAVLGHESCVGEVPGGASGASVDGLEILRASAIQAAPPRITLSWPSKQHHVTNNGGVGLALSVQALDPLRDAAFEGLTFYAAGGTIAVGVRIDRAIRVAFRNCRWEGFSRAGLEMYGCSDVDCEGSRIDGECCCAVYVATSCDVEIVDFRTKKDALRSHALGLKRACIFAEFNPINLEVRDFLIQHVVQGISIRGGRTDLGEGVVDDCDIRTQVVGGIHGNLRGVGIDTGNGEGAFDEYVKSVCVTDVTVSDCRGAVTTNTDVNDVIEASVMMHDCHQSVVTRCSVVNNGLSDQTTVDGDSDYRMFGFGSQDSNVQFNACVAKGVEFGYFSRASLGIAMTDCKYIAAPGAGPGSTIALWILDGSTIDLRDLDLGGGAYVWFPGGGSAVNQIQTQLSGKWRVNDRYFSGSLVVAQDLVAGFTHGQVVALAGTSPAGMRQVITPAGGSVAFAVLCGLMNDPWRILKLLPGEDASVLCTIGAGILVGDYIEAVIGSRLAAVGVAPNVLTIGQSLDAVAAAGGSSLIRLKPTPWVS